MGQAGLGISPEAAGWGRWLQLRLWTPGSSGGSEHEFEDTGQRILRSHPLRLLSGRCRSSQGVTEPDFLLVISGVDKRCAGQGHQASRTSLGAPGLKASSLEALSGQSAGNRRTSYASSESDRFLQAQSEACTGCSLNAGLPSRAPTAGSALKERREHQDACFQRQAAGTIDSSSPPSGQTLQTRLGLDKYPWLLGCRRLVRTRAA